MQREGLIAFALLLTLAVLAPEGGDGNLAEARTQMAAPVDVTETAGARPAMSLTGPATPAEDCELHEHGDDTFEGDVALEFKVNVSI